jgi:hypothetical protein
MPDDSIALINSKHCFFAERNIKEEFPILPDLGSNSTKQMIRYS